MQRASGSLLAWLRPAINAQTAGALLARRLLSGAAPSTSTHDIPAGHLNSDLSDTACHIGLGRRRDLTLRADVQLYHGSKACALAELFKGHKTLLVGFPGGGVCEQKHLPEYFSKAALLKQKGVTRLLGVTFGDADKVAAWAATQKLPPEFEVLADSSGAFFRLLGLETSLKEGPKCQRFAAIIEDGILLKLKVERSPAEVSESSADSMLKAWASFYE